MPETNPPMIDSTLAVGSTKPQPLAAIQWLGRTFDYISQDGLTDVFDPGSILIKLKEDNPVLLLHSTTTPITLQNLNPARTFDVPNNISIHTDVSVGNGSLRSFKSGEEVNHAFEADAKFSAEYMGVTVSGSSSYSYKSDYTHDQQYAFTSSSTIAYAAIMKDIAHSLNPEIRDAALALPPWSEDFTIVQQYFDFFSMFGTHVVTAVYYGWRIQIQAQADNTGTDSTANFAVDVSVKYLNDSADASVTNTDHYRNFSSSATASGKVYGGNPHDIAVLKTPPYAKEDLDRWTSHVGTAPDEDIVQVEATEIGTLYKLLPGDTKLQKVGTDLRSALTFIRKRRTTIRIQKHCDWTIIAFSSPGVSLKVKPPVVLDPGAHQVIYGGSHTFSSDDESGDFQDIFLFNNGQPLTVTSSHGREQNADDRSDQGWARFRVFDGSNPDGTQYENRVNNSDQNFQTWINVPVNSRVDYWNP